MGSFSANGYIHPKYGPQETLSHGVINMRIRRIVRMFKWAVSEELVPATVLHALQSVRGLEKGRTEARECEPVTPVALAVVEDTIPFLTRHLAAMVRLQLLTGMRPAELCIMRTCGIDTSGAVWLYRPRRHMTAHRGKPRIIALGPRRVLLDMESWLTGRMIPSDYCLECCLNFAACRVVWKCRELLKGRQKIMPKAGNLARRHALLIVPGIRQLAKKRPQDKRLQAGSIFKPLLADAGHAANAARSEAIPRQ